MDEENSSPFSSRIFLLCFLFIIAPLFLMSGCASTPVIKMPAPLPDIVKEYKSMPIGLRGPEYRTGVRVKKGDFFSIIARGEVGGPRSYLKFDPYVISGRIGEKGVPWRYGLSTVFRKAEEEGEIYFGNIGGISINFPGAFDVDVIVWKKEDPILIAKFLEELSFKDPSNETLKEFAKNFKNRKETILAEQKAKKEVEETEKAILALKGKEIPELQMEELKKKLAEQQEKEKELMTRLDKAEQEKWTQAKIPPWIAIASPKDGASVDFEYISISGVAESGKGLAGFEIFVNRQPVSRKDQSSLELVGKDLRRFDFSERIHLREGRNEISVVVRDKEGLESQRRIFIQFARKKEEVWAVVIGINRYKNFPALKYSVNDAREFYRYLVEVNGVPKDHIWLLLDEEATLDKLRSTLATQLRRQAGKDDMVIIYLAGHGITERDAASVDGDGLEKYILPHNGDPKDLYTSAMPMSEVARIFSRISSERLVFISDTCYSGASGGRTVPVLGARGNVSGAFLDRLSQGRGRVILTASDANEVSMEKDELQHGVFTYYLLEALGGKADLDGNGLITFDEVYRYVSTKVPQATGQEQHPVKKGEMVGEIVLGILR